MLKSAAFMPGQAICLLGRTGHIRLFEDDLAVISFDDGRKQTYDPADLRVAYSKQQLTFIRPTSSPRLTGKLTDNQKEIVSKRDPYVRELSSRKETPCAKSVREDVIQVVSKEIGDLNPPSIATLSRWYSQWLQDGRDMTLQVVYKNKERRSPIEPEILKLMLESIEKEYKKRSKPSIRSAYRKFCAAYNILGYEEKCPDESTFRRRIKKLDRLAVIAAREGVSEARSEARVADQHFELSFPLERVELDTAHFNIGLLNDDGYYVGKVSLYLVIDTYSRAILGFAIHVGKAKETAGCVVHAIRHAIAVKGDPDYPMYGLFRLAVTDAGPGYRAEMVRKFLEIVADEYDITPTRMGWAKPFIERFISSMRSQFFQELEGYLGKYDPGKYTDQTLIKSAKYTVDQFRQMVSHFIVHVYHKTPHSGLNGKTPLEIWNEGIKLAPPVAPADLDDLKKFRGMREEHVLQKNLGITLGLERFNSSELQALYHRMYGNDNNKKNKILVAALWDPLDATAISVVDADSGELIDVPNVSNVRPGVSFAELKAGKKATTTAEEVPYFETSTPVKPAGIPNKKGPDVSLDDGSPFDLGTLLVTEGRPPKPATPCPTSNIDDTSEEKGEYEIV